MTIPFSVTFAYCATNSISSATTATYTIAWAKGSMQVIQKVLHTMIDFSTIEDAVGTTLVLQFKLGKIILSNPTSRAFFRAFFKAPYRWAVYGDFKDTANAGYSNLCQCRVEEGNNSSIGLSGVVDVSMAQDAQGYILVSTQTY